MRHRSLFAWMPSFIFHLCSIYVPRRNQAGATVATERSQEVDFPRAWQCSTNAPRGKWWGVCCNFILVGYKFLEFVAIYIYTHCSNEFARNRVLGVSAVGLKLLPERHFVHNLKAQCAASWIYIENKIHKWDCGKNSSKMSTRWRSVCKN